MSIEKAELKLAMAHEIGVRLDDLLDAAHKTEHRLSGVPEWLRRAAQAVLQSHAEIEKAVEAQKLDLEQAKQQKDLITEAHKRVMALIGQAEAEARVASGCVRGLQLAVTCTKRAHDEEAAKGARAQVKAAEAVAEGAEAGGRKPPLKARRAAEAAPKKKAVKRHAAHSG
jgi:hypothetical protein